MDLDERRAYFVYEASRIHAFVLGCPIIPRKWRDREDDFKEQFIELIKDLVSGKKFMDFEADHDSWMDKYLEMGWKYGKIYDPVNRVHPDLVPYKELDPKEKAKDKVFLELVKLSKKFIW